MKFLLILEVIFLVPQIMKTKAIHIICTVLSYSLSTK